MTGFISALSFPNVFYLLRRAAGRKAARKAVAAMRDIFDVVPLDAPILNQAIDSDMADVEDAIQFFSAVRAGAATLITRDPGHFPAGNVVIQTPAEFLATHYPE